MDNILNNRIDTALELAGRYGQIQGDHHRLWVIDQMVRALTGCPLETQQAPDCHGQPYMYEAQGESEEYRSFVEAHCAPGEDGDRYEWETGIAP